MKYRRDKRTVEEFAKDIKNTAEIEQDFMQQYIAHLNKQTQSVWTFKNNGVDNQGSLIKDDKKVSAAPDFIIYKNGKEFGYFDVKFSRKSTDILHIKENHLKKYIKHGAGIILFMNTDSPEFLLLTIYDLEKILKDNPKVMFWDKWCRKIKTKDYQWTKLFK
jgi:hypothetical protein